MAIIINSLEKTPIIEIACNKIKISRSTLYRWFESDPEFKHDVDQALDLGRSTVTDVAESHLISGVKDGEKGYVKYWLSNNCIRYKKNQLVTEKEEEEPDLTDEDKEDIANAMRAWADPSVSENERDEDYEISDDDPSRS